MNEIKKTFIPGVLTYLNLSGGFIAIILSIKGEFKSAAWLIIAAVLCDAFDGLIARKLKAESDFGFQLDSLADLITSGLAPAIFIYCAIPHPNFIVVVLLLGYCLCSTYRLARYNVTNNKTSTGFFSGLPAPVAAVTLISFWLFKFRPEKQFVQIWLILLTMIAILMVSEIKYRWPHLDFKTRSSGFISILKLSGTVSMILLPGITIFPFFMMYILLGIYNAIG